MWNRKRTVKQTSAIGRATVFIACIVAFMGPRHVLADGLAVTDVMGRTVRFEQPPQRIVVTGKASFMIANAVALFPEARQRELVFPSGLASRKSADDFLALVMPEQHAPSFLAGDAGVEQIAATRPDVVLLKSSAVRLGDRLGSIGIPVVYTDFETPAQYPVELEILGRLFNAEDRAESLAGYYADLLTRVEDRTKTISAAAKPKALLLQYSGRGGAIAFSVPPPEWIQTELVERAGGIAVWKVAAQRGGWTVVNLEQIAAWDPDIILLVSYTDSANQPLADILADKKWEALRARREQNIFAFPGDFYSWDQPDTRWGLGLLWLAMRLHPTLFPDIQMPDEVIRFYSLYGLNAATVQSQVMPLIKEDITRGSE